MKRTQIYIDEMMYRLLEAKSKVEKKTISQLIRESIEAMLRSDADKLIANVERVRGLRCNERLDVDGYIRTLRKDRKEWSYPGRRPYRLGSQEKRFEIVNTQQ